MKAEWHNAADFAEVAEALKVRTVQIMAVGPSPRREGGWLALYTASDDPEDTLICSAFLRRDDDGILCVMFRQAHPGMWDQIVARAEIEIPKLLKERGIEPK